MLITPVQQYKELTTVQKQREEMKAIEEKKANETERQTKAKKEEDLKLPEQKPTMLKEKTGNMVDFTA